MASEERITVYNLADLKNTSDDAIPNYLNSLKFKQSHNLTDVRLALGYSAFILAGACFAWDYKFGFDATKYYTAAAVAMYTLLNGALTLWIWLIEKGVIYEGTSPSGEKISISSSTQKNVPIYNLTVSSTSKSSSTTKSIEVSQPFANWFDSQGRFVALPFQEMLARSVPAIGKLDAKRLKSASTAAAAPAESQEQAEYDPEVLDAIMAASSSATATGSAKDIEASIKKASKRRKA